MKVLVSNKLLYPKGGVDVISLETIKLLRRKGHQVCDFTMKHPKNLPSDYEDYYVSQVDYEKPSLKNTLRSAGRLLYSWEARRKIEALLRRERPDIAELHNIYHQISPSILHSFKKFKVPVVMVLHDYKVVCASYSMLAGGKVCEACRGGKYLNCFRKACVKGSKVKSLLNTVEMYLHHKVLRLYDLVDVYISPSRFLAEKVREMGFKKEIVLLPNFVNASLYEPQYHWTENSFCYVGRLSPEKGLRTLLEAARGVKARLKIIGEGPMKEELVEYKDRHGLSNVDFLGFKSGEDLKNEVRNSMFTVLASECYENHSMVLIESFALGKPAIASRIGGNPELVRDGKTGWTFQPGDADDLRAKITRWIEHPEEIEPMGRQARKFVEEELDIERYYGKLMNIFNGVLKR